MQYGVHSIGGAGAIVYYAHYECVITVNFKRHFWGAVTVTVVRKYLYLPLAQTKKKFIKLIGKLFSVSILSLITQANVRDISTDKSERDMLVRSRDQFQIHIESN